MCNFFIHETVCRTSTCDDTVQNYEHCLGGAYCDGQCVQVMTDTENGGAWVDGVYERGADWEGLCVGCRCSVMENCVVGGEDLAVTAHDRGGSQVGEECPEDGMVEDGEVIECCPEDGMVEDDGDGWAEYDPDTRTYVWRSRREIEAVDAMRILRDGAGENHGDGADVPPSDPRRISQQDNTRQHDGEYAEQARCHEGNEQVQRHGHPMMEDDGDEDHDGV